METTLKRRRLTPLLSLAVLWPFSTLAAAQAPGISVENRAEAADAYDHGTSAYLSQHYERAAHWFERAYRLAPTSTALLQAVRAHEKAGNPIRAANLALQLKDEYPSDERAQQVAQTVIASVKPLNVMVEAECAKACTLELDGTLVSHPNFFVTPDVEHSLKAAFHEGETSAFLQGAPGDVKAVKLAAPAPPPTSPAPGKPKSPSTPAATGSPIPSTPPATVAPPPCQSAAPAAALPTSNRADKPPAPPAPSITMRDH